MLNVPELALQENEARDLSRAIAAVNKHYALPGLNPKHQALLGLGVVAGRIYAPRVMAISARTGSRRGQSPPRTASPAGRGAPAQAGGATGGPTGASPAPREGPEPPAPIADPWFLAMGQAPGGGQVN